MIGLPWREAILVSTPCEKLRSTRSRSCSTSIINRWTNVNAFVLFASQVMRPLKRCSETLYRVLMPTSTAVQVGPHRIAWAYVSPRFRHSLFVLPLKWMVWSADALAVAARARHRRLPFCKISLGKVIRRPLQALYEVFTPPMKHQRVGHGADTLTMGTQCPHIMLFYSVTDQSCRTHAYGRSVLPFMQFYAICNWRVM